MIRRFPFSIALALAFLTGCVRFTDEVQGQTPTLNLGEIIQGAQEQASVEIINDGTTEATNISVSWDSEVCNAEVEECAVSGLTVTGGSCLEKRELLPKETCSILITAHPDVQSGEVIDTLRVSYRTSNEFSFARNVSYRAIQTTFEVPVDMQLVGFTQELPISLPPYQGDASNIVGVRLNVYLVSRSEAIWFDRGTTFESLVLRVNGQSMASVDSSDWFISYSGNQTTKGYSTYLQREINVPLAGSELQSLVVTHYIAAIMSVTPWPVSAAGTLQGKISIQYILR